MCCKFMKFTSANWQWVPAMYGTGSHGTSLKLVPGPASILCCPLIIQVPAGHIEQETILNHRWITTVYH